jgi:hypothetical protein
MKPHLTGAAGNAVHPYDRDLVMRHLRSLLIASAFLLAPPAMGVSLAQNGASGSDVPPATQSSAVAGAVSNGTLGTTTGNSNSPTSGTAGGGMSSGNGMKAGGTARKAMIHHRHHYRAKHKMMMTPTSGAMAPGAAAGAGAGMGKSSGSASGN